MGTSAVSPYKGLSNLDTDHWTKAGVVCERGLNTAVEQWGLIMSPLGCNFLSHVEKKKFFFALGWSVRGLAKHCCRTMWSHNDSFRENIYGYRESFWLWNFFLVVEIVLRGLHYAVEPWGLIMSPAGCNFFAS